MSIRVVRWKVWQTISIHVIAHAMRTATSVHLDMDTILQGILGTCFLRFQSVRCICGLQSHDILRHAGELLSYAEGKCGGQVRSITQHQISESNCGWSLAQDQVVCKSAWRSGAKASAPNGWRPWGSHATSLTHSPKPTSTGPCSQH
jgi:hypothetical protein